MTSRMRAREGARSKAGGRRGWPAGVLLILTLAACELPFGSSATVRPSATPRPTAIPHPTGPTESPPAPIAPPVVFYGGTILTQDPANPRVEAMAVLGDRIVAIGEMGDVMASAGSQARVIDLQGRTLIPGFIDGHSHRIPQRFKWGFETVDEAVQSALEQGWTGITEMAVDEAELAELIEAAQTGRLRLRVNAYLLVKSFEGVSLGEWFNAYRPGQQFGPFLRIAGLKVFTDFANGTVLYWEQAELNEFLRQRQTEGWQVTLKSVSTLSLELTLNAIESALQGQSNAAHRYRVEHALSINDEQLSRMAQLGVIASIQPGLPGVISGGADLADIVALEGTGAVARWRDLVDAGVPLVASPLNPDGVNEEFIDPSHVSPLGVIYRGTTQIGLAGRAPDAWMLDHALEPEEILPLLTIAAAYSTFEEEARGSLAPGKLADLVILSEDPSAVPAEQIPQIDVLMTMVGGRVEWCAPAAVTYCPQDAATAAAGTPAPGQIVLHQPGPIVVAYLGPETGTGSALFGPMLQSAQKAIEDHGPVHGYDVVLVPFNDQCDTDGGGVAAQQVVADDRVAAVLGPLCSRAAMGALPFLEASGVAMISGASTLPGLSAYGPGVFHRTVLDEDQIAAAGYASQSYTDDLASVQSFYDDFAAWGGSLMEEGLNHYLPYQYDAMRVLLQALDLSAALQPDGSLLIDRAALRATVRGTASYPGLTGSITFDSNGNRLP